MELDLDDGRGGLGGAAREALVEEAEAEAETEAEVEVVVFDGGGGGCGSDEETSPFGFDLAAAANSAGNGVLLAAMPQAYSISNLKPWEPA